MNKEDAILSMNKLGGSKNPFLFIIDYEMLNPFVIPGNQIPGSGIKFESSLNGTGNGIAEAQYSFIRRPVPISEYSVAFDGVHQELLNGNSYLLNLTFPTEIETNLSLEEIFILSRAKYKLYYPDKFVVFSPETFITISNGIISTFPMKGTIDASIDNAREVIMHDEKEFSEHATIVDLMRNDLSMVANDVVVDKYRYIEKVRTNQKDLFQVSSKITGKLPEDYLQSLGDILFTLLPAGSISGAPKKKTLELIDRFETYDRGYFTGIFGYFDGKDLWSAVMIRFIEKIEDGLIFKSGGGITTQSEMESEYQEMVNKVYVPIY